jgi:hypothetical protein
MSTDSGRTKQFCLSNVLGKVDLSKSVGGVSLAGASWTVLLSVVFIHLLLPVIFAIVVSLNPSDLYTFHRNRSR